MYFVEVGWETLNITHVIRGCRLGDITHVFRGSRLGDFKEVLVCDTLFILPNKENYFALLLLREDRCRLTDSSS